MHTSKNAKSNLAKTRDQTGLVNHAKDPKDAPKTEHCNRTSFAAARMILGITMLAIPTMLSVGCSGSEEPTATAPVEQQTPAIPGGPSATEIVSQFLDRVRRGGENSDANSLLTKLAQQEMTRIGRPLAFPGSPDTRFQVQSAYPVPDQEKTVWVPTILAEPSADGSEIKYEVVWTVRLEKDGWRISGFTMEGEGDDPMPIDFENGAEMEARLSSLTAESGQTR